MARLSALPAEGTVAVNDLSIHERDMLYRRSRGICERCRVAPATDAAHRIPRRARIHGPHAVCDLCRHCHRWCHENPQEATLAGWMVSSHEPHPERIPLRHHGYWEYLNPDGSKVEVTPGSPHPGEPDPGQPE